MAEVFLARHQGLEGFEKSIVIKRIRPHLTSLRSFVNMFLEEAKLAAQLSHPNIIQIYDLGKIDDSYFIAMEYVDGRDLAAIIPRCRRLEIPFPIEYALKIGSNVCEALHYAHSKADPFGSPLQIVHRDVSPENVRVAWSGAVKILDFGIAKAATKLHDTKSGQVKGKVSYMSPEQIKGDAVDARSDLFSLGAVLYETMTGLKVVSGNSDLAVMQNMVEGKIYPPSYFRGDLPSEVEAILMKALEKKPARRYQSASEMQLDIDAFLARHEFTPSNTHLANFLKQIFRDDIEVERRKRRREADTRTPAAAPRAQGTQGAAGKALTIHLDDARQQRLAEIAGRRGVSPEEVVVDIVAHFLSYQA
jgi:serine/threonine-protein kinase